MSEVLAIRLEPELLRKIDGLMKEEGTDRSTVIRGLIRKGYSEELKEKAARQYREGRCTLSEAARRAGISLWDMEHYLIDKGFKSEYSIDDLEREMELLS
ncbi:UPF0175 family protein [Candidatus Woesearchaeota archaeon]|nr:UPF0175 family protein [Candidatus Woesearchaeota archaeon]